MLTKGCYKRRINSILLTTGADFSPPNIWTASGQNLDLLKKPILSTPRLLMNLVAISTFVWFPIEVSGRVERYQAFILDEL